MKKLVLFFAVAAAVSFAACTNKPAETTEAVVADTTVVEVVECDSCTNACDSCEVVACDSCQAVVEEVVVAE